ncbi:MAG: hypothetical protein KHZ77_06445 [Veillonella sp.]|uniref:hypothetical protein n=1 Tax=Veillonella sp. TaxID=1926307 RepID=UPI0025EEB6D4|nr:hypothetical protein [Veillonella sp.]MBS4913791.1 hypothetical protein [Veillonella sp.]
MKLWKNAVLALGVLSVLSFGGVFEVNAASWYYIGENIDGEQYSVDNDSVVKNDQEATMWIRVNNLNGEYYLEQVKITRDKKTMQTLDVKPFYADGTPYAPDEYYFDTSVDTIEEGSMGAELYQLVWANK